MSIFWESVESVEFYKAQRGLDDRKNRLRFVSSRIAFTCTGVGCGRTTVLRPCARCGEREYFIGTATGNVGLYCSKCRTGFQKHVCACGHANSLDTSCIRKARPLGRLVSVLLWAPWHGLQAWRIRRKSQIAEMRRQKEQRQRESENRRNRVKKPSRPLTRQDVQMWVDVFHQRKPGWIGQGFPGRAIGELKEMAQQGYAPALKALKSLFANERDSLKRARLALALKEVTGKDFLPPGEINLTLAVHSRSTPLPPAPDDQR